jgi:hypothetical protein
MGGTYAFDPSDTGARYHSYQTRGGDPIDGDFHYTEHENIFGATVDDGKAEAFRKVQAGLNPESLQTKAEAWQLVHTHINGIGGRLQTAYTQVFNAWSGDDADVAQKTFNHVLTSTTALTDNANSMYTGTKQIAAAAAKAKSTSSDGPGFGSKLSGGLGLGGGDGDGNADVKAYFELVDNLSGGRDTMPQTVQWQVKTDATGNQSYGGNPNGGGGGGVSGVSSPHMGGSSPHSSVATPNIKNPGNLPHHTGTGIPPIDGGHPGTTPIGDPTGGTPGTAGGGGSTVGVPHIDTGSTLAGMDGSGTGFGGTGSGAYGGGGLGSMSAGLGGGVGGGGIGGGIGGTSGLAGEGLGAAGAGAGAGIGAEGAGAGVGAGRAGGMMMPMRGGAGSNDEDERERSTWLEEDDDVWGEADAPPSVIR